MAVLEETKQKSRSLMTGNEAVAEAVRLARPGVIPAYPITPQTAIVESIAKMAKEGLLKTEYMTMESEHSVMSAAIGASLGGSRTFTATSSHGLMYMGEMLFWSGLTRIPVVMAVVNRSLNPWNIWVDHQDSMAFRDAGWLQFYAKNNQEVLDLILIAYRVAENHKVWMPAMICLDGFVLSHTSSLVSVPDDSIYEKYVHDYDPLVVLDNAKPFAHGALTGSAETTQLRESIITGFENAKKVFRQVNKEYADLVGRDYGGMIEVTGKKDAKYAVMALGTMGEECEAAVDLLASKGIDAKVVRPRVFRPFPKEEIINELKTVDGVLILDRSVSFGNEGPMAIEVKAALFEAKLNIKVESKVVGLGGMDVNFKQIAEMLEELRR